MIALNWPVSQSGKVWSKPDRYRRSASSRSVDSMQQPFWPSGRKQEESPPHMSKRVTELTESVDWELRQDNPVRKALNLTERVSLATEKPIDRLVRMPQLNPLYHTGTITISCSSS